MFSQARPWVVFCLVALLALFWSLRLGFSDVVKPLSSLLYPAGQEQQGQPAAQAEDQYKNLDPETAFIRQATDVEFPTPIDYKPLQEACTRKPSNFRPGLLFTCEEQHGGIGMIRNQILKCVRYAINGGGALVIPSMQLRNAKDISDIETNNEVPLEYLLERETFKTHLTKGCPGMQLYERAEDFPFYDKRVDIEMVGDQFEKDHPREGLRWPRAWRRFFDEWLDLQNVKIRTEAPVHIKLEQSFLEYPVHDDGIPFLREFGKILSFRNDTRAMAAKILWELKQRFTLPIDPAKAITPGAYYGAHLRLETDAILAWPPDQYRFSNMTDQFKEQFRNINRTGLNVVYVASGNQTVVELFAAGLKSSGLVTQNVTVVTKQDLLQGPDLKRLEGFTFDQQGLVDFMMMFKASAFMGVASSSFPWTVALRRHELSKYDTYANEGSDLLRDEYSIIMGMAKDYLEIDPFVTGIWP